MKTNTLTCILCTALAAAILFLAVNCGDEYNIDELGDTSELTIPTLPIPFPVAIPSPEPTKTPKPCKGKGKKSCDI